MERKLVTIRKIKELQEIKGADLIELAIVDGWKTIVRKGAFSVGDYGIYFEIDSLIPIEDERFSFIETKKTIEGQKYRYLRTIKLKNQISQGLILPLNVIPEIKNILNFDDEKLLEHDFASYINVIKYEEPDDAPFGSEKSGTYPTYIQKTGEKRIQNVYDKLSSKYKDVEFIPTLKMDGSSMTVCYVNNPVYFVGKEGVDVLDDMKEQIWVASSRMVIREPKIDAITGELESNAYYDAYYKTGLEKSLPKWCKDNNKLIAVQGELLGPKIQKNFEKYNKNTFKAFYVYFIDEGRRATQEEFVKICSELNIDMIKSYPPIKIFQEFDNVEDIIKFSEGQSEFNKKREGLVFKSNILINRQTISFKVISNLYLLNKK